MIVEEDKKRESIRKLYQLISSPYNDRSISSIFFDQKIVITQEGHLKLPAKITYNGNLYGKRKMHGFGILENPKKKFTYIGYFYLGKKSGYGITNYEGYTNEGNF